MAQLSLSFPTVPAARTCSVPRPAAPARPWPDGESLRWGHGVLLGTAVSIPFWAVLVAAVWCWLT